MAVFWNCRDEERQFFTPCLWQVEQGTNRLSGIGLTNLPVLANMVETTILESNMTDLTVASTEFQTRAGLYIERAAKTPVFITKHSRPVRVLIDIDEYERLKARDTRQAITPSDLTDAELEHMMTHHGPRNAHLDHLMD